MMAMSPPRFFLPEYLKDRFKAFLGSMSALDGADPERLACEIILVRRDEKFQVKPGLWVQPLASPHTIPMVSYVVWKDTKKLKAEYMGLPGSELGKLRKSGVQLEDVVTNPVFAYTGDTTAKAYEINPILLQVQTLAMELTFFQDYPEEEAAKHGHTHINDVIKMADRFENKEVVLVHPSARYHENDKAAAHASLPESLRNRSRWL
jgi:ribonuclease Z